ncbi:5'-3' exoribonuclease 2 [Malassezia yamatoensis]|uniref:5'-3' exoribonuclease n=1 Tax=Malassezia yamatoensis TaxID=253288 RepID=A0AAJ6CHA3_9BASI|nr:5'-3' exoribonuclease 2 [Malassezia yamatoensis]
MNGIVHPCTHPEGKPPPQTEQEMMTEVFAYTERVINMIRPRKLLMMAIDGVAPRAKMNQQRSRRFRSAQDAQILQEQQELELEKRKDRGEAQAQDSVQKSWDSNAITPGTPFMDLLASSLRYWIAHKLNTDPGWKHLCVVLSDASVPGEGEHKIMDYIRRKRSDPNHDPNTKHVIYGLDADLIMLSLATHEPYFKVLREDVFAQDSKSRGCHACGKEGHIAANCNEPPQTRAEVAKKPEKKPFIFLDVPTLREYLEIELQVPNTPFPFDLERAIDDWVFLIFFVGNDFLPHLPSLEIREGAIDTLLQIWKRELPRMGGYVTNNGKVELENAQHILDGLMHAEDEIFRKRKETEERQEANARRRKQYTDSMQPQDKISSETQSKPVEMPNLKPASKQPQKGPVMLDGDSMDVVRNRAQIRMANISAADALKQELSLKGKKGTKRAAASPDKSRKREKVQDSEVSVDSAVSAVDEETKIKAEAPLEEHEKSVTKAFSGDLSDSQADTKPIKDEKSEEMSSKEQSNLPHVANDQQDRDLSSRVPTDLERNSPLDSGEEGAQDDNDDEDPPDVPPEIKAVERKVNADGTVDYEDTVKLWEPGYRERYYRQKFGVELSDHEFRRKVVQAYVEGLCWVLAYYYQGCPSWKWYYPYHYAPFAADFTDIASLQIRFQEGEPFRPFEQLMGVLPAASRTNLPEPFQELMTDEDSEIYDFYPTSFSIDMNGKKMAWQGVALLPFIDESRLLGALRKRYPELTDDEIRRNSFGRNALFVGSESELYGHLSRLYAKRSQGNPETIDTTQTTRIAGSIAADPSCVPSSTFHSPLPTQDGMLDIHNDSSISAFYTFPPQRVPHRSVLLNKVRMPRRRLNASDAEFVRRGSRGNGMGRGSHSFRDNHSGRGRRGRDRDNWSQPMYGRDARPSRSYGNGPYGSYGGGGGGYATGANAYGPTQPDYSGAGPYGDPSYQHSGQYPHQGPYGAAAYAASNYGGGYSGGNAGAGDGYGASYGATGYGAGGYGAGGYGAAGYGAGGYSAGYGATGYGSISYGANSYGTSGYAQGYGGGYGSSYAQQAPPSNSYGAAPTSHYQSPTHHRHQNTSNGGRPSRPPYGR